MTPNVLDTKCPHCEGPLVLQRAAPGDGQLRITCSDCGASATSSGATLETIRVARVGTPPALRRKVTGV